MSSKHKAKCEYIELVLVPARTATNNTHVTKRAMIANPNDIKIENSSKFEYSTMYY